ncbi:MAG TPA: hypothetical protein VM076_17305 [Gemmatimonadaceae bacterium]|nr:hypothetical protein [Gemmatimonadaceae bacterium]
MISARLLFPAAAAVIGGSFVTSSPGDHAPTDGMTTGAPDIQSAGPLALGPGGVLFVGDSKGASVFALSLPRATAPSASATLAVPELDAKIAAILGTTPNEIRVRDMVVDTVARTVYLSVARGRGPDAQPALMRVTANGAVEAVRLDSVTFSKLELEAAPGVDQGFAHSAWRNAKRRNFSVTDVGFVNGELYVTGVTNEEFASSLHRAPFPFNGRSPFTRVSMYHTSHGMFETEAPIETFIPMTLGGEQFLIAGYACTPIAKFPISGLAKDAKLRGTTVMELGSGNRPDDMMTLRRDGEDYLLIVNSSRGLTRVRGSELVRARSLTSPVEETAGAPFKTLDLKGIRAIEPYAGSSLVVLQKNADSTLALRTMDASVFVNK